MTLPVCLDVVMGKKSQLVVSVSEAQSKKN